jgi:Hemocyanin, ig-like domain
MNTWRNTIVGRTRRMDTKQFTVSIDLQSNKNQNGIVRIFLGPRINNKQQLDDNRQNFVELDQFIVKLNQGQNFIKRNSRDFKNVVGEPETMSTLYFRALNLLNKKNNGNDMNKLNFDTNNNNQGFPHRLVLPKGTVGGEDYTLYVICSDLNNDHNNVQYRDNLNTFNSNKRTVTNGNDRDSNESNDSNNSSNDSNDSNNSNDSDSNESRHNGNDRNGRDNKRDGRDNKRDGRDNRRNGDNLNTNNMDRNGRDNRDDRDNNRNMGRGNWEKNNGVMIHNNNNGNKNCGNGNGVLDTRAMGFPLDRQIVDITGFVTNNMFFKDVTVFHVDNSNIN